ncbi:DegT/DnrJ/EryC1/StrS family aminotransferase [Candidatus Planktophila sulfonica]|uniref:DegT/DnrJ/EryC1/StrS family aminotransferase n=1 Tax=Candidatus Planktophila sulfonica TaxID=1884904 RepID=UPI00167FDEA3|nr:DegT/DnrJ/EryC1/StrS family aminotransferase [Candidatus Planktophila sulfonica]
MSKTLRNFVVPAGNLAGQNTEYLGAISEQLKSGSLIGGNAVSKFEENLATYVGANHVLSLASGMDALIIGLTALNLPPMSNVLVADNAGGYASLAVLSTGHRPIFCDVNPSDFEMDLDFATDFSDEIQAVVVTHLYGRMADMNSIMAWAKKNDIKVIEDCAQSIGAIQDQKQAGTFGDIGTFSFYPTKNLGGVGDGGAICTDNDLYAERINKLRQYGWKHRYNISEKFARNSRLDSINAAVLDEKLKTLNQSNMRRREILTQYISSFSSGIFFQDRSVALDNVAHLAVGVCENPTEMINFFGAEGVELTRHYPIPDSLQEGLNYLGVDKATPTSHRLCKQVVSLPIYPWLTDEQVNLVCIVAQKWSGSNA